MAIYDYLPTFNYIEPNNLKGLQPGFVVAQMPIAASALASVTVDGEGKLVENGTLFAISADGLVAATADAKNIFIAFNEPLHTIKVHDAFYATKLSEEHVRAVQLIPGDEWMGTKDLGDNILGGRIVKVTKESELGKSDDWYACETMADGTKGYHYVFLG